MQLMQVASGVLNSLHTCNDNTEPLTQMGSLGLDKQ